MYVDGFVLPVPKKNIEAYKKVARKAGKIWMEYGALQYVEAMGDDVPPGEITSFELSVKAKKDEVVFFSYIVFKSRAQRDKINKKVMTDPRLSAMAPETMPFDSKRMIFGGFKPVVSY